MRTLPASGRDWFSFVSFVIKLGILSVCPAVYVWYFVLDSDPGAKPASVVSEMRGPLAYVLGGYLAVCVCLSAMGVIERVWQRRKQAVWDFVFAGLALLCWGLICPLTAQVK